MLRLEAPITRLQIADGTSTPQQQIEITSPTSWVRTIVHQHEQAQVDIRQLYELCGDHVDRTDRRIQAVERAYDTLYRGTLYIYERGAANEIASHQWLQTVLTNAANAYQTFSREVWQAIIERTTETDLRTVHQATQVARLHDAVAFLSEANAARQHHLNAFTDQVTNWAAGQDAATRRFQPELARTKAQQAETARELAEARVQMQQLTDARAQVPLPPTASTRYSSRPRTPPPVPTRPTFLQGPPQRRRPTAISIGTPRVQTPSLQGGPIIGEPPRGPPTTPAGSLRSIPRSPTSEPRQLSPEPRRPQQNFADDLARAFAAYVPRPRLEDQQRVAPMKLPKPESYDGKPTTPFRAWWKTVRFYFGFYPNTLDAQRIAFVGALLTGDAKEWHQERDELISPTGEDTWAAYSEAIQAEYLDQREGATAHAQLKALEYKGNIKAYLTAFKTLNRRAGSSGEGLQDIINEALSNNIIDVRFYQNPRPLRTDEEFLTATYEAGCHVEELQALKQRKKGKETGKPKDDPKARKTGEKAEKIPRTTSNEEKVAVTWGGNNRWASEAAALAGVPAGERTEYATCDGCRRCGKTGHGIARCWASSTIKGTHLPTAPWKVSAGRKRAREPEDEAPAPPAKQARISAAEVMDLEPPVPIWEESDTSDF